MKEWKSITLCRTTKKTTRKWAKLWGWTRYKGGRILWATRRIYRTWDKYKTVGQQKITQRIQGFRSFNNKPRWTNPFQNTTGQTFSAVYTVSLAKNKHYQNTGTTHSLGQPPHLSSGLRPFWTNFHHKTSTKSSTHYSSKH